MATVGGCQQVLETKTLALEIRPKDRAGAGYVEKSWSQPCGDNLEGLEYRVTRTESISVEAT